MQNLTNLAVQIAEAEEHLAFQHNPDTTDGWITIARKDPNTHIFKQYHFKPDEIAANLTKWIGENVYISQNTFYKPQRRIENIRQLRSLYVDLDVYNLGLTPEWVRGKLDFEFFGQTIPDPNIILYSGRGLVLIWEIEPVPHMAMPLWKAVENYLTKELAELGADNKATDPARVFRLAGSINSKSHTMVKAEYRHTHRYDLRQLQYDYLPDLSPGPASTTKKRKRTSTIINLFNTYTLHLSRARDISKLVEIRAGDVTGYREIICFLYRYYTCCYTSDPEMALEDTLSLNKEFTYPLPEREVIRATKSAEKAWEAKNDKQADELAKSQGYPGAGYNITNGKLIDWMGISKDEQKELSTIIGPQEKRRRNTEAKRKARRAAGVKPMEQEIKERKEKSQAKEDIVRQCLKDNPNITNKELSGILGCSTRTIQRIKASIV